MSPTTHQRFALSCLVLISLFFMAGGVVKHGLWGMLAICPGILVAALFHSVVVENLPLRCPKCAAKARIRTFMHDFPRETNEVHQSFYYCTSCPYEEGIRLF